MSNKERVEGVLGITLTEEEYEMLTVCWRMFTDCPEKYQDTLVLKFVLDSLKLSTVDGNIGSMLKKLFSMSENIVRIYVCPDCYVLAVREADRNLPDRIDTDLIKEALSRDMSFMTVLADTSAEESVRGTKYERSEYI